GFLALRIAAVKALKFGGVGHAIGAYVNHGGSCFDEIASDHSGASDGGNQNVGTAADGGQITRFGVANGDGSVGIDEQHGDRLAYNVTTANNDRFLPSDRYLTALENFDDAGRSAGH